MEVTKPDGTVVTLHVAFIGVKGDWPWQRALLAVFVGQKVIWSYLHLACRHALLQENVTDCKLGFETSGFATTAAGRLLDFSSWL